MSGGDPRRAALDARVLAWMNEPGWEPDEARFDALARDLFAHQAAHCPALARFAAGRGLVPGRIRSWRDIPGVPTGAFKEVALRTFPAERTVRTFRTSGTTTDRRGELHLDTLALYEASLSRSFQRFLLPDLERLGGRIAMHVLAPSPAEAPDSSLSHMFGVALAQWGAPGSAFHVARGALREEAVITALAQAAERGEPALLAGTAFAFVHLLDRLEATNRRIELPPGSRAMETGGFKGRARELPREDLHARMGEAFGIPAARIVNQYGMTELGSQFYDSVLVDPEGPRRKLGPPWARVRVVDPETRRDVPEGGVGILTVVDLANTGSVVAVETADLGRRVADGFEVLGRARGAEARGCSIAADAMLSAAEPA